MATKKKTVTEAVEEAVPAQDTTAMYVGPTIPALGLIQNVVYTGIPESAEPGIKAVPLLSALFISVNQYPEAERAIREETGYIWSAFRAVSEYRSKLKNGGR